MKPRILLNLICVSVIAQISAFSLTRHTRTMNPRHFPTKGDFDPLNLKNQGLVSEEHAYQALLPRFSTLLGAAPLAEGESAPAPEPTQGPIPESEGTKGPNSEAEPNSTSESEPEPKAEAWPEPGPLWSEAFKTWKSAWGVHIYFFATLYLLMALYAVYYVVFNIYDGLDQKYLSVSLNIMVLVFCLSRSFILYLDPYHQGGIIHALKVMHLLWSIGGPCLTASDSLIILALLEMCHLRITIPSLQKASVISVIITLHFLFVIVTDFVVAEYVSAKGMILFCQIFYMVWGFVLGTGYMRLGYVLDKQLFGHKPKKEKQDKLYTFLIYASGIANYGLVAIMLYTAVGVFGVYSSAKFVDAWHWYILQSLFRFSEVITCVLIFTVSAKRTRVKQAMDDISAIGSRTDSEIPTVREPTPTEKWRKTKSLLKGKRVDVRPFESTEEVILTKRTRGAPRERRMSMFTDMETTSKIVMKIKNAEAERNLALAKAKEAEQMKSIFSRTNNLFSTFDENETIGENIEAIDKNFNAFEPCALDVNDSKMKPNLRRNVDGFLEPSRRRSKSYGSGDNHVVELAEVDEECDEKGSNRSRVRKISSHVLRRLPQPFVKTESHKGHDDGVILQDELQGSTGHNGLRDNLGFQYDERDIHHMPNVPV